MSAGRHVNTCLPTTHCCAGIGEGAQPDSVAYIFSAVLFTSLHLIAFLWIFLYFSTFFYISLHCSVFYILQFDGATSRRPMDGRHFYCGNIIHCILFDFLKHSTDSMLYIALFKETKKLLRSGQFLALVCWVSLVRQRSCKPRESLKFTMKYTILGRLYLYI